jgi:hypothetical protein
VLRTIALVICLFTMGGMALADDVKVIMGFEADELAAKKGKTWCELEKRDDGCDFWAHFEFGEPNSRIWTWRCVAGDRTEGKQALVASISPGRRQLSFEHTPFQERFYPVIREGSDASVIFTTFQWLGYAAPELRDWTGWDLLRVDVKPTSAIKVWLGIEDEVIEPPVVGVYALPAGKWITLEIDLNAAAKLRRLDRKHMTNIYLTGSRTERTTVLVDNIRLVKAGAKNDLPVLRDETPMEPTPPAFPAKPEVPALAADFKPDLSPVTLEKPTPVTLGCVVPVGWIAAADNRHLFLGCSRRDNVVTFQSSDGGKTWESVSGPNCRNLDHGTSRGSVIDARGDAVTISSGPGCSGAGLYAPRQHLTKYTFTGTGWERRPSSAILDYDIRHCGSAASVVRLPAGAAAGRLWAAWGEVDRLRRLVVHCKYSDDDGKTWWQSGGSALVPESHDSDFSLNTYSYQQARITYFRGHAAVFWQDAKGLRWSRFDGKAWSPAEAIDADAKAKVAVSENEGFRVPGSVVTVGEDQVFLTAWNRPGVFHFDGKSWKRELTDADDAGMLTVLGGKDVCLVTMGHTEEPPPDKRIKVTRETKVLCYRRKPDGTWDAPLDLAGGPVKLLEYRQMTGVVVPPASPANFAPVAFSDGEKIWLVKVPALAK